MLTMGVAKEHQTFLTLPSSRQSSAVSSLLPRQFGFDAKQSFNANKNLLKTRSESFTLERKLKAYDAWDKPAPDFRLQLYHPHPPKIQSRDSNPRLVPGIVNRPIKRETILPRLHSRSNFDISEPLKFVTRFRTLDSHGAKILHASKGVYPVGPYCMPKPHDHRALLPIGSLGYPEFRTDTDRDPYNIAFKTSKLDIVHGLPDSRLETVLAGDIMAPALPRLPRWQKELILETDKYPTKPGAYTRHRPTVRSPHSAFMERVEDKLADTWRAQKRTRVTGQASNISHSSSL